ncbi:MAG: DUF4239 domain-containing protein [Candidatus Obscuribacterales bacterium]|nr:DUF4239 domain-containing protein [Candidatus Obscuribacterales bacterium]
MSIDSYGSGVLLVLGSMIASVVGLLIARKLAHLDHLKATHEVGGYLLSVVGTMYAVLLGLVVVDAMSRFQQGISITESEANSLADVFILSQRMPTERALVVQRLCHRYADLVINDEWKKLDSGHISKDARRTAIELMKAVSNWEPSTESEKAIYPIAVTEACQLWDCRRSRTNMSQHCMPPLEWYILIIGGVVTVVFTYFFGIENLKAQIAMTAMVSMIIALNLFLVMMFGYPFSGELKVAPSSFELDKKIFDDQLGISKLNLVQ